MMIRSLLSFSILIATSVDAAEVVEFSGYSDCIQLSNDRARVILCPSAGGRVLEYSLDGKNALYLDPSEEGWVYQPGKSSQMSAGRFDIGPEKVIPNRPHLWMGRWQGEVTDRNSARMTSVRDKATGTQLVRDFELSASGSRLVCRQTIKNISDETTEWCHWSRTFALGNGVCVIPLSRISRFPNHYVMYESPSTLNFHPEDPKIKRNGEFLVISGVPKYPKLGMDSKVGWFAYLMKNDLMFVKRFPTYDDRVYNEVAGLTISIWYPQDRRVELEPIGPRERLEPGQSASFEETWELRPFAFPKNVESLDPRDVSAVALSAAESLAK
jgi:hypothetical protein